MSKNTHDSDDILKRLFEPQPVKVKESLLELFEQRLLSLEIRKTTALKIMGMGTRTLDGILSGEQKLLDYTQLIKLSNFLGIELDEVAKLYLEKLKETYPLSKNINQTSEIVDFLNEKFNLAELRKVGIIKSLTDYDEIINSVTKYFGLKDILDYREPQLNVVFSAGKKAKKNCSLENWMFLAEQMCIELRNPNDYNRDKLIDYFPLIRSYSMDVLNGLVNVIKHLYQLGITVVFVPSFPSLHIRGATFVVNDKPCIALTDYRGFYPTLWFGLIHELYHVLFDWDEIFSSNYHISLENQEQLDSTSQNELEADEFARKYLFSLEKTKEIGSLINNQEIVREFATVNHVDPSFIYVFYAYDAPKNNKRAWGRARKLNPTKQTEALKRKLQHNFKGNHSFDDHIKYLRNTIYN